MTKEIKQTFCDICGEVIPDEPGRGIPCFSSFEEVTLTIGRHLSAGSIINADICDVCHHHIWEAIHERRRTVAFSE